MTDGDALRDGRLGEGDGDLVRVRLGDIRARVSVPLGVVLGGEQKQEPSLAEARLGEGRLGNTPATRRAADP
ncbi:hypothetical protein [Halorubrum sp. SD626R]|uniref:hypothetical protein n=1 Tax=Halorubrum sp. SD626R TaxID=1419722 RepID=UPI00159EC625|nr:hypothetical protein [Halorubrum sp. SD626R]